MNVHAVSKVVMLSKMSFKTISFIAVEFPPSLKESLNVIMFISISKECFQIVLEEWNVHNPIKILRLQPVDAIVMDD